jgi:hypothetical protein
MAAGGVAVARWGRQPPTRRGDDPVTDTDTTPDVTATVDAYFAMLNETDRARRDELAAAAWTDEGYYVDPLTDARGPEAISAMVGGAHTQFPGQHFARTSGIDSHHGLVRFAWELAADDGTVTVAGIDVGIVAADGRLSRIAGFFGPLPDVA